MPDHPVPDSPMFLGGRTRLNNRFRMLCNLAGIRSKTSIDTGKQRPWMLKDLRKTCATYYDEHVPESSVEILGHFEKGGSSCARNTHPPE